MGNNPWLRNSFVYLMIIIGVIVWVSVGSLEGGDQLDLADAAASAASAAGDAADSAADAAADSTAP